MSELLTSGLLTYCTTEQGRTDQRKSELLLLCGARPGGGWACIGSPPLLLRSELLTSGLGVWTTDHWTTNLLYCTTEVRTTGVWTTDLWTTNLWATDAWTTDV